MRVKGQSIGRGIQWGIASGPFFCSLMVGGGRRRVGDRHLLLISQRESVFCVAINTSRINQNSKAKGRERKQKTTEKGMQEN